jgi:hypothetical protein
MIKIILVTKDGVQEGIYTQQVCICNLHNLASVPFRCTGPGRSVWIAQNQMEDGRGIMGGQ